MCSCVHVAISCAGASLVPVSAGLAAPLAEQWPAAALPTLLAVAAGMDGNARSFGLSLDWQACLGHTDFEQAQQPFGDTVQLLWCNAAQSRIAGCSSAGAVAVWDCRSGCWPPAKHVLCPEHPQGTGHTPGLRLLFLPAAGCCFSSLHLQHGMCGPYTTSLAALWRPSWRSSQRQSPC